jgi:hypothetical protein
MAFSIKVTTFACPGKKLPMLKRSTVTSYDARRWHEQNRTSNKLNEESFLVIS